MKNIDPCVHSSAYNKLLKELHESVYQNREEENKDIKNKKILEEPKGIEPKVKNEALISSNAENIMQTGNISCKRNYNTNNLKIKYKLKTISMSESNYRLAKIILIAVALYIGWTYVNNTRYVVVREWYSIVDSWTGNVKPIKTENIINR